MAVQRSTNLQKYLRGDVAVPSHLGDRGRTYTCLRTQVFLLHIFVDEQLPEFFITDSHKTLSSIPSYEKMLYRLAEHLVRVTMLPRPITTLTALFIMIAHFANKYKKMINLHDY